MGFKKIEDMNKKVHDRECMIIVNFPEKEKNLVKNMASMVGIKDIIVIDNTMFDNRIEDILDDKISVGEKTDVNVKALLFNSLEGKKVNAVIEGLRKMKIRGQYMAMITENSIEWELKKLIYNLVQERKMIKEKNAGRH